MSLNIVERANEDRADVKPHPLENLRSTEHTFSKDIALTRESKQRNAQGYSLRAVRFTYLILADTLAFLFSIFAGFGLSYTTRALLGVGIQPTMDANLWPHAFLVFVLPVALLYWKSWVFGHYTRFRPIWTELREVLRLGMYFGVMSIVILFVLKLEFSRLWLGYFLILLCICVPLVRYVAKRMMIRAGIWFVPTYIVGTGENAVNTAAALDSDTSMGHGVVGFINLDTSNTVKSLSGRPVFSELPVEKNREVPCLVFAFDSLDELNRGRRVLNHYIANSSTITIAPPINGLPLCGAKIINVFRHDTVLLKLQNNINNPRARVIKRAFDIIAAIFALLLLSPVMLCLYFIVGRDGGNPIYAHRRVGKNGNTFDCLKFRSMIVNSDEVLKQHLSENPAARAEWMQSHKLSNDPRITSIGRFMRESSLDELPQLLNVLRGEMSIVGPRPIVTEEQSKYGEYLPYYLEMVPGITGLWQTSGRSNTSYRERVLLDVWYSRNWSIWHDLVIILRTVPALINSLGAK